MDDQEHNAAEIYFFGKTYVTEQEKVYIRNDPVVHMAAGDRHTIIITESGRVYAFGDNTSGQLGLGHTNNTRKISCIKSLRFDDTEEKVILAACGRESSLVATNHGSLYTFGLNNHCQLGIESSESTTICPYPMEIEQFHLKASWKQISMGAEHACALTDNGIVYTWGSNEDEQCGHTRQYHILTTPKELRLKYFVSSISCGYYHTALIDKDGRLFLFGNNDDRQLGCSTPDPSIGPLEISLPDPVKAVACGNQHTVVLTQTGKVYVCGKGDRGQLGLGSNLLISEYFEHIKDLPGQVTNIAAGEAHTVILGSHDDIYVFGDNRYGKLMDKTHSNEFEPHSIIKFKGYNILKVVCGGCQTIILVQKKLVTDDMNIKNAINCNKNSTKSIKCTNRQSAMNACLQNTKTSYHSREFSSDTDSSSDADLSFKSTRSTLMNAIHVESNGAPDSKRIPFRFSNSRRNVKDSPLLKPSMLNQTMSLPSKRDRSQKYDSKLNGRHKSISDGETISSEESSDEHNPHTGQHSTPDKALLKSIEKRHHYIEHESSSATTISRSSSASSDNDNQITSLKTLDDLNHSFHSAETELETINSHADSTKTEVPQLGFFSRIFTRQLSVDRDKSSKICLIM